MGENSDKITGKVKETAGNVTGDDSLKREARPSTPKARPKA